jgi:hypothetical protein
MVMIIFVLVLVLVLAGCTQQGYIKVHRVDEDGTRKTIQTTEVKQPAGAIAPASLTMGMDHAATQPASLSASTGAGQPLDQALAQLSHLPTIGIGLCVIGVLLIVAKAWFPLLPLELGIGLMLLGGAIIMLPMLLDRYMWVLVIALVGVGLYSWNVWRQNKLERNLGVS